MSVTLFQHKKPPLRVTSRFAKKKILLNLNFTKTFFIFMNFSFSSVWRLIQEPKFLPPDHLPHARFCFYNQKIHDRFSCFLGRFSERERKIFRHFLTCPYRRSAAPWVYVTYYYEILTTKHLCWPLFTPVGWIFLIVETKSGMWKMIWWQKFRLLYDFSYWTEWKNS